MSGQEITVPLPVGSRVTLYEEVDIDDHEGVAAAVTFEDYVKQYSPDTALLRFEESDIGYAKFQHMVEEADGIQVIQDHEYLESRQ